MDKFCTKCGAELPENGVCPNCSEAVDEVKAEQTAPEKTEIKEEPIQEAETAQELPAQETEPEQTQEQPTAVEAKAQDVQLSKFYYAFRQVGKVLKYFFSKNTVAAVCAQYNEILPIWVILLPVCAIISALSMTLSFDGTNGFSIGAGSLFSGMSLSGLEVFLISFAMSVAVEFVYSIAVMIFFKTFKLKTKFKQAANLTLSAYIAVTVMDLFNIITIGSFKSESTTSSGFGMIAFILLLYLGITKILEGKKPFWSFFLMMTCASVAALIAALVVTCPIIVMRGLEELARTAVLF